MNDEDQNELKDKFGLLTNSKRKRKGGSISNESTKAKQTKIEETPNEQEETSLKKVIDFPLELKNFFFIRILKEQSELLWNYKDQLRKEVSGDILKELLEFNTQMRVSGESNLIESVTDCMAFGALQPCPECGGFLLFKYELICFFENTLLSILKI